MRCIDNGVKLYYDTDADSVSEALVFDALILRRIDIALWRRHPPIRLGALEGLMAYSKCYRGTEPFLSSGRHSQSFDEWLP